jgi:ferredoxin
MRVRVDPDRCQGHTLCTIPAPQVFALDEDEGHAHVVEEFVAVVPPELEQAVRAAASACPERAIEIFEA